jgi:hypothetical protein
MKLETSGAIALLGAALTVVLAGCGTPGAPQPPSLNLPEKVTDLSAVRTGNSVALAWTMPKRNTDKLLLKAAVTVRVCREDGASGCVDAGRPVELAPGTNGTFSDALPAAETAGGARPLRYFVELKNRNGRSAGLSNAAVVLAGAPPTPVADLAAEVHKAGVVLRWTRNGESTPLRLDRTLLTPSAPKEKPNLLSAPPEPVDQTLRIDDVDEGQALDKTVRFGEVYSYRAQRVAQVTVDGQTLELAGELSAPLRVEVKEVFAPSVPAGLVAVATIASEPGSAAAIDLSWQPDADADVVGYAVYRREAEGVWQRISAAEPVVGPAFHDAHVEPGHTYRYAVAAIDQGGHESTRSAEAVETVPPAQ